MSGGNFFSDELNLLNVTPDEEVLFLPLRCLGCISLSPFVFVACWSLSAEIGLEIGTV